MIATPQPVPMSAEAYLVWEPQQELRYEFNNGQVYAMTGGTVPHNDLAINILSLLLPQVRAQGCRINMADVKLQVDASQYYYPDLMVSCDARDLHAHKFIQYPKLIVEVLSPGTAGRDRGDKFRDYQRIPTLQEYLLVNSEKMGAECYRRGEGRMWLYYPYNGGDLITLESLGCHFTMEQLYQGVAFPPVDIS
jgi:Uma2 family endonuclease